MLFSNTRRSFQRGESSVSAGFNVARTDAGSKGLPPSFSMSFHVRGKTPSCAKRSASSEATTFKTVQRVPFGMGIAYNVDELRVFHYAVSPSNSSSITTPPHSATHASATKAHAPFKIVCLYGIWKCPQNHREGLYRCKIASSTALEGS